MYGLELTQEEMELALEREIWLDENIVGFGESAEYVYASNGGYDEFYEKWVWRYLFPWKFEVDEGLKK